MNFKFLLLNLKFQAIEQTAKKSFNIFKENITLSILIMDMKRLTFS